MDMQPKAPIEVKVKNGTIWVCLAAFVALVLIAGGYKALTAPDPATQTTGYAIMQGSWDNQASYGNRQVCLDWKTEPVVVVDSILDNYARDLVDRGPLTADDVSYFLDHNC